MDWFELVTNGLINYGPYALAALFLVFLAPRQTRRYVEFKDKDKKKQTFLLTVAIANWAVAFLMCFYIYNNWSPSVTYTGSLGLHSDKSNFVTADKNSYIASHDPGTAGEVLAWQFAYISPGGTIKQNESFNFTHHYKGEFDDSFNYYQINAELLKKGPVQIRAAENDPSKLVLIGSTESTPLQPSAAYQPDQHRWQFMAAYAVTPADAKKIIRKLSSDNIRFKVAGQNQLRSLKKAELEQMLNMPDVPDTAKRQIQAAYDKK